MGFKNRPTTWLPPEPKARRKNRTRSPRLLLEMLESRITPSFLPAPDPINPTRGESNLLHVTQMHADNAHLNALDHFPVPFTVIVSAGGAPTTIMNWKAGAPLRIDADQSRSTGQGGQDLQVEVNTDKYAVVGGWDWKLRLNVNRIGSAPFANNVDVSIAFPFDAFNLESLPAAPNLLMGYQTRLPGTPGTAGYITGLDGGVAPESVQMVLTPHILGGTVHAFEWDVLTTNAPNPVAFYSGEFDGNPGDPGMTGKPVSVPGSPVNVLGWQAYVQNVPGHIGAEIKVSENAIGSADAYSKMDLHWTASSKTLAAFDYLEAETQAKTAEYATQIVADQMPTDERFVLTHDEAAGTLVLDHLSNSPVKEMSFLKRRVDGLALTGVAADDVAGQDAVPTSADVTLGLRGYATVDVNANTLDLFVQATQTGGFNNTAQFFENYDLEYTALKVKNSPDLTTNFDGVEKQFTHVVTHVGEVAPFTEMVLDDNGRIGAGNAPLNLELPEHYATIPAWHIWSIVDDGTQGTAAARALDTTRILADGKFDGSATYNHDAPTILQSLELRTVVAHPMQTFLKSGLLSAVQPPVPAGETEPDPYIEVTGHVEDVPTGRTKVTLDFPLTATWVSEEKIGEICMAGHIGTLNFGLILEDNPVNGSFDFRPEGSLRVIGLDAGGNPDFFTGNAAIVYDVTGFDPAVLPWPEDYALDGFHSKNETFFPANTPLKEARLRLDHVPSLRATWHDEADHTFVDIDTDEATGEHAYVGGVQVAISTKTTLAGTTLTCDNIKDFIPPEATDASTHYGLLKDVAGEQTLKFGIFGVNSFHFNTDDAGPDPSTFELNYELDPSRPFTAANITVDSNPTSTGALGTYFGGDDIIGDLDISYVPSSLWLQSNLDPTLCTKGFLPPGTPVPSDVDMNFNIGGTDLFIHARDLAPNFCLGFDVSGSTSTLTLESTNLAETQVINSGLVEILFQNKTVGLDSGALFTTPVQEFRLRFDDVPSVKVEWNTAPGTQYFEVNTLAADDPTTPLTREDILGGLRMKSSVVAGPTSLPAYSPLVGGESHFFRFIDTAAEKKFEGQIIDVDRFKLATGAGNINLGFTGRQALDMRVQVTADNGKFFPGYDVNAGLFISKLPTVFDLVAATNGQAVSYVASDPISEFRLGGPAVIGAPGPLVGNFDKLADPSKVSFQIDMKGMPAKFGYTLNPGQPGGLTISAKTAGGAASDVDSIIVRVQDPNGLGGAGLLGTPPIRDARVRLDHVPSLTAGWSSGATGMKIDFSTDAAAGAFQYLGGAQVALSTVADTVPFAAPVLGQAQKLTYGDDGGDAKKFVGVQLFGLDEFHFATTNAPRSISLNYAADSARPLIVDVDAAFGNKLFADNDVDVVLTVTDIPTTWSFSTDFATKFDVNSTGGTVNKIEALGEIKTKSGMDVHTTQLEARILNIPGTVHFQLVPATEGFAELTLSNPIQQVFVELKSDTKIFGEDYKHIRASVDTIPANWKASWGLAPNPHAELVADQPLGPVSLVLSKKVAAETPGQYTVFQTDGGSVEYTDYAREIDRRYLREGDGDENAREAAFMTRLDALYKTTSKLDPNEDHLIMRKNDEGKPEFISVSGTGFQGVSASFDGTNITASVHINVPGDHSFFIGMENFRPTAEEAAAGKVPEFITVDIQNIPDTTTVIVGPNKAWVDFSSSAEQIVVYKGNLPGATDGRDALKVLVKNTPTFFHLDWTLAVNGNATLTTSNPVEVALLNQSSSSRMVADFTFQNISAQWGTATFEPAVEIETEEILGVDVPIGAALVFKFIEAFVKIDASPGVDGFLQIYDFIHDARDLENGSPAHSGNQYVPRFSVLVDDLTGLLDVRAGIKMALLKVEIPPFGLIGLLSGFPDLLVPVPYLSLSSGAFSHTNFDWWDMGDGPLNVFGDPDYMSNDPWDVWPLIHTQSGHLFPFGPLPPMLAASPAPIPTTDPNITSDLVRPLWEEAARRWSAAGATPDQIRRALATTPTVTDLPGQYLGATENGTVYVDADAAGWGWFIDPTLGTDEEFDRAGKGEAAGRMDLLTVLSHEMGRLFGYDVKDAAEYASMSLTLSPGMRLGDYALNSQLTPSAGGLDLGVPSTSEVRNIEVLPAALPSSNEKPILPKLFWYSFVEQWKPVSTTNSVEKTPAPPAGLFDRSTGILPSIVGESKVVMRSTVGHTEGVAAYDLRQEDPLLMDDFVAIYVG